MIGILVLLGTTILTFIISMIWYSPLLFGKAWMKLVGLSRRELERSKRKGMAGTMTTAFIMNFIMVLVLWVLTELVEVKTFFDGATLGGLIWVGTIMTALINPVLWAKQPLKLYYINAGHYLVIMVLSTGLVAAFF